MGPVEYMIMTFPTTGFDFRVGPAIQNLVDAGTIAVLDLVLVAKDADGCVATLEVDEESGLAALTVIDGDVGGLISEADIDSAGAASSRAPARWSSSARTGGRLLLPTCCMRRAPCSTRVPAFPPTC